MELDIHGKQMDVGEALRNHVTEKIQEIDAKYFNHATSAVVTFTKEGHGHDNIKVHIAYHVGKDIVMNTEVDGNDAYAAFDEASEKTAKRLRRHKRRLRDHHERQNRTPESEFIKARNYTLAISDTEADEQNNIDDGVPKGDDPLVIAEMSARIETISVSDAVMRLDLSGENALMFRNSKTNNLNMVYRRSDGNIGWVDPSEAIEKAA